MSAPSYADALRILELIHILQQHAPPAMRVAEIAERLGVSTRTIGRYVRAIEDGHRTTNGRPLLRRERRANGAWVVLESGEWLTAALLRDAVASTALEAALSDPPEGGAQAVVEAPRSSARTASRRASSGATSSGLDRRAVERMRASFHYVPVEPSEPGGAAMINVVLQAIVQQRAVEAVASEQGGGERRALRLEPFSLVMHRDALYVVGRMTPAAEGSVAVPGIDTLALSRLVAAELTEARFERPRDFSPARHFSHGRAAASA